MKPIKTIKVKICGITQLEQGVAIAGLGVDLLGFICVPSSPRYVSCEHLVALVSGIFQVSESVKTVGVFANTSAQILMETVKKARLTTIQLHGEESPAFCEQIKQQIKQEIPHCEVIKALRIRHPQDLSQIDCYQDVVDALLLDAYHPRLLGGTGHTLDWSSLRTFQPKIPWFLAGGLTPENITLALQETEPDGVDVSSGVERSPGNKDLERVKQFVQAIRG